VARARRGGNSQPEPSEPQTPALGVCDAAARELGSGGSSELPAELELAPDPFAAVPAQAVASVALSPAPGGACPLAFEALLPDTSASQTFVNGTGPRAIDGEDAPIACSVLAAPDSPGAFELTLSLRHPRLPWLRGTGRIEARASSLEPSGASAPGMVTLRLTTPDATEVTATCSVEADEVLSGAVWFHSTACQTPASEPRAGACEVAVRAIFENCRQ
jgi:hypothetical protein